MRNFICSKGPQRITNNHQFSEVRNSAKHIMVYLQCPESLAQLSKKLERPLLYTQLRG